MLQPHQTHVRAITLGPCLVLATCCVWGALACDDQNDEKELSPPIIGELVTETSVPGLPLMVTGNFFLDTPDDLTFELGGDRLPVRALTPRTVIASLPLDATTNILRIGRPSGSTSPRELNLSVLAPDPPVFVEVEPNDTDDTAQTLSFSGDALLLLARAEDATTSGNNTDVFSIDLPSSDDGGQVALRVVQTQHGGELPLSLEIAPLGGAAIRTASTPGGQDLSLLFDLPHAAQTYVITVSTGHTAGHRYDIEGVLITPEKRPDRPILFSRSGRETGLATVVDGVVDAPCDRGAIRDVNGDGHLDLLCGALLLGLGDGTFAPPGELGEPDLEVRSVNTRWEDFTGDGKLDLLVLGPGPRTHRLLVREGGAYVERTLELGLATMTGMDLIDAHATDLDRDGSVDLILVTRDGFPEVFRNQDGGFTPWEPWDDVPFSTGDTFVASVVFDGDDDGDDDWLLFHQPEGSSATRAHRIVNRDGVLERIAVPETDALRFAHPPAVVFPVLFDSNPQVDLMVASRDRGVEVLYGNGGIGNGAFEESTFFGAFAETTALEVHDFNTDGRPDVFASSPQGARLFLSSEGAHQHWRVAADLPRGFGLAPLAGVLSQDGTPSLLLAGRRYKVTTGSFSYLRVQPRSGGRTIAGARIEVETSSSVQWRRTGLTGFGLGDRPLEEVFYFPETRPDSVTVSVEFPSGYAVLRTVSELDTTLVVDEDK